MNSNDLLPVDTCGGSAESMKSRNNGTKKYSKKIVAWNERWMCQFVFL